MGFCCISSVGAGFVWFFMWGLRLYLVSIVTPYFANFVFTLRQLCLINLMSMKQKNLCVMNLVYVTWLSNFYH